MRWRAWHTRANRTARRAHRYCGTHHRGRGRSPGGGGLQTRREGAPSLAEAAFGVRLAAASEGASPLLQGVAAVHHHPAVLTSEEGRVVASSSVAAGRLRVFPEAAAEPPSLPMALPCVVAALEVAYLEVAHPETSEASRLEAVHLAQEARPEAAARPEVACRGEPNSGGACRGAVRPEEACRAAPHPVVARLPDEGRLASAARPWAEGHQRLAGRLAWATVARQTVPFLALAEKAVLPAARRQVGQPSWGAPMGRTPPAGGCMPASCQAVRCSLRHGCALRHGWTLRPGRCNTGRSHPSRSSWWSTHWRACVHHEERNDAVNTEEILQAARSKKSTDCARLRGIDANVRFGQHLLALVARPVGAAAFCALVLRGRRCALETRHPEACGGGGLGPRVGHKWAAQRQRSQEPL